MTDPVPAVLAYADRQSVRPKETIDFKVSAAEVETFDAAVVRLLSPDVGPSPHAPDFREVEIPTSISGLHPAIWQPIHPGSYVLVPLESNLETPDGFTIVLSVFPTNLAAGRQTLIGSYSEETQTGLGIFVDEFGRLGFVAGDGAASESAVSDIALDEKRWSWVAVAYDGAGTVRFHASTHPSHQLEVTRWRTDDRTVGVEARFGAGPLLIAAQHVDDRSTTGCFNGRIERPRILGRVFDAGEIEALAAQGPQASAADALADWDLSIGIDSENVSDVSGNGLDGTTEQMPTRGVGGSNWSGETDDWRNRPAEYGAIHFHDDDLLDAGWDTTMSLQIPDDWPSGCYAGRFRAGDAEFYVPFVVRPPVGESSADVLYLIPTATYAAYVNLRLRVTSEWNELIHGRLTVLDETDLLMLRFPEIGLSTYDSHGDGSTVVHSSMHRPVTNFRPKGRIYKFCQDLLIVAWLEQAGISFDVMTDEDLHREGVEALEPYRVVITASHAEYVTTEILDALEAFVRVGGRLMNLGGNVFWHRIAYHPTRAGVTEVRRPDLPRLWRADVSQGHHTFTGEAAGTWIGLGRAPHLLSGSGFVTQGFDECSYYRKTADGDDPRVSFIFEGVDDEIIGDFGIQQGGAAGYEIDRADAALGTPAHALIIASSENHSNLYDLMVTAIEDVLPVTEPGESDRIRADMVFFETAGGGAVFSVGSIAWSGSLSHDGYANNVAKLTDNVFRRFLDPRPFEVP